MSVDFMKVNHLARLYVRDNNLEAIKQVALELATCSDSEKNTVTWWWNEGCRDYANSEDHLKELNNDLIQFRDSLM